MIMLQQHMLPRNSKVFDLHQHGFKIQSFWNYGTLLYCWNTCSFEIIFIQVLFDNKEDESIYKTIIIIERKPWAGSSLRTTTTLPHCLKSSLRKRKKQRPQTEKPDHPPFDTSSRTQIQPSPNLISKLVLQVTIHKLLIHSLFVFHYISKMYTVQTDICIIQVGQFLLNSHFVYGY